MKEKMRFQDDEILEERLKNIEAQLKGYKIVVRKLATQNHGMLQLLGRIYAERWQADAAMSPQERAWSGKHGFQYIVAHLGENWKGSRGPYWKTVLDLVPTVTSICEFGCNIGANLKAIHAVAPHVELSGIEINPAACDILRGEDYISVHQGSIVSVDLEKQHDLVFSRGVLIHINPDDLGNTLKNMAKHAGKYVLIYEIYSENPISLAEYSATVRGTSNEHGEAEYQFWQDFPGEFAKLHPDWRKISSGVSDKIGMKPKHGDIYWGLFARPE